MKTLVIYQVLHIRFPVGVGIQMKMKEFPLTVIQKVCHSCNHSKLPIKYAENHQISPRSTTKTKIPTPTKSDMDLTSDKLETESKDFPMTGSGHVPTDLNETIEITVTVSKMTPSNSPEIINTDKPESKMPRMETGSYNRRTLL